MPNLSRDKTQVPRAAAQEVAHGIFAHVLDFDHHQLLSGDFVAVTHRSPL